MKGSRPPDVRRVNDRDVQTAACIHLDCVSVVGTAAALGSHLVLPEIAKVIILNIYVSITILVVTKGSC